MVEIVEYEDAYEEVWDEFVMYTSINGTFLQTRRFLNYHPPGRFHEASILFLDKGKIIAVCPACCLEEGEKKVLFSHKGATFGGLIIHPKYYHAEKVIGIVQQLDRYLIENNYSECVLKITPDMFAKTDGSLLRYCLENCSYKSYSELNTYIDLEKAPANVIEQFDRNKKRNIEKCEKFNLTFRELEGEREIEKFHLLLSKNLEKYDLKPIHTVEEIKEFNQSRLKKETKFYGVFNGTEQIASGMMFVFEQTNVIHAQNLSADYTFSEYSPITYLYYKVIERAKEEGYRRLSWGISTENQGKYLNRTLVQNKESYGSKYALNYTFYKEFSE